MIKSNVTIPAPVLSEATIRAALTALRQAQLVADVELQSNQQMSVVDSDRVEFWVSQIAKISAAFEELKSLSI